MTIFQLPPEAKIHVSPRGAKYVYFDYPYWDKSKSYGKHQWLYIGKISSNDEFIPNDYYQALVAQGKHGKPNILPTKDERELLISQHKVISSGISSNQTTDKPINNTLVAADSSLYYGAIYLLERIGGSITGVIEDLSICFPEIYTKLLSIVFYLILESHSPLYRFNRWALDHKHPYGYPLSSQRISELIIDNISERQKQEFYKLQASRRIENDILAFDTTSVSSNSQLIKSVKYGRNKDDEHLPQINIAMLIGENSRLPVFYRMLPGNISDVSTIEKLIKDIEFLNIKDIKFVLDRGFYSSKNINLMYKHRHKFIISSRRNISIFKDFLLDAQKLFKDDKINYEFYDEKLNVYSKEYKIEWKYIEKNKYNQITNDEHRDLSVHIYYNESRGKDEKQKLYIEIKEVEYLLNNNQPLNEKQKNISKKYFISNNSLDSNKKVVINLDAVSEKNKDFGFFILITNYNISSHEVLSIYRNKDIIEKCFDNLKDRLELKRTEVHSDRALDNKLFILFIALIFISHIDKVMKINNLYKNRTMDQLLDDLDIIKICYTDSNNPSYTEITEKQRKLYEFFNIQPPAQPPA
ncbi:MAG: IS1634 family transposase [Deltaproteobacteria bacterium]|jgi:transposase|nr:IS1634 family transposase [Deltaproteobacteria bacterium]